MFDNNETQMNAGIQTGAQVDAGLKSYMLKVYNYMTLGLMISGFAGYLLLTTGAMGYFFSPTETGGYSMNLLGWIVALAPIVLVFKIVSATNSMNPHKAKIYFFIYSALCGFTFATLGLAYTGTSIAKVFFITAATFGATSLYGYTTKRDLTGLGHFMIMGVIGLVIASVVNIFMQSSALSFAISAIGVVVFTALTAYDTQKIRSMYNSYDSAAASDSKAINGALSLYLDFINMFIFLMQLLGDRK